MAGPIIDLPADVDIDEPETLAVGYRTFLRYHLTLRSPDHAPVRQERDIVRSTRIIAVLPVDLARGEVVLIRQFRLAGQLANGAGDMIEIVAGAVEDGEEPATAAWRECREEIGVAPEKLAEIMTFMTTPGISDETIVLYVAAVDAATVPPHSGLAEENEQIATLRVPIDEVLAIIEQGGVRNGPMIIALQWLVLNRDKLATLLA